MIFKYFKEALDLRRQAIDLAKAEKRLARTELDYLLLERLIKGTNKEIVVKLANGTSITVKEEKSETGYKSFIDRYRDLHK